jgi:sodium/proline symporter
MTSDTTQILVAMGAYMALTIGVGLWYSKRSSRNAEAYFLGGRGLGPWVAAMSAEASDMSGWLLMGLPGVAYFTGAGEAAWTAIGLAIGTYACWRLVARRLRAYSFVAGNAITLPGFFSNRFHDEKRVLSTIAAVILLVFFSIYVGSQFVTFGKLFGYVFGMEGFYARMVVVGAVFVLVYTFIGGFLAETMSDFIQGTLMFCALVLVLAVGTAKAGGVGALLVDLVGPLGGVGEDDDLVVGDLEEAAEDGHGDDVAGDVGEHLAVAEGGHEGGVVREDGDLALGGGDDEALHVVALEDGAFRGDDAE